MSGRSFWMLENTLLKMSPLYSNRIHPKDWSKKWSILSKDNSSTNSLSLISVKMWFRCWTWIMGTVGSVWPTMTTVQWRTSHTKGVYSWSWGLIVFCSKSSRLQTYETMILLDTQLNDILFFCVLSQTNRLLLIGSEDLMSDTISKS